jgi:hypothetical protein
MAKAQLPRASDYEVVWDGPAASVRLAPRACQKYRQAVADQDTLSVQRRTHLERYFTEFCGHPVVHKRLNDQQFKREGSFKDGYGGEISIWTFKARKWRVYGAILVIGGKRCFVGTRVDSSKKQDKADQDMLRQTAKDIGGLLEVRAKG